MNTHVHADHVTGTGLIKVCQYSFSTIACESDVLFLHGLIGACLCTCLLQSKVPGAKSIISKASGSKADLHVEHGDKVSFGDLFLEVCIVGGFQAALSKS